MDLGDESQRVFNSVANISCAHTVVKLALPILWHFLHLVVNIWYFGLGIAHMLESYVISSGLLKKYINLDLSNLRYLAIVIDSEEAKHTSRVVELLRWLSAIGVKHVCLYDMDGVLKESEEVILQKLGDARRWEEADEKDLFLERKQMILEFVSFSDGKEGAAKAASYLCSKYLKVASMGGDKEEPVFTEPDMDRALRAVGCGGSQPDLLLIYAPARCHLGFPAWRLRYTEIVHMGPLTTMKYGATINAIHKYTMVNQNYEATKTKSALGGAEEERFDEIPARTRA